TLSPRYSGTSTRGNVSKTARNVMGWPSSILRSETLGMVIGLRPRPSISSKTTLLTIDSATSPSTWSLKRFRITSRATLPRPYPGTPGPAAVLLAPRLDLLAHHLGLDLERQRLADRGLFDELDFQAHLVFDGMEGPLAGPVTLPPTSQHITPPGYTWVSRAEV